MKKKLSANGQSLNNEKLASAELEVLLDELIECELRAYNKMADVQQLLGNYRGAFLLYKLDRRSELIDELRIMTERLLFE